MDYNIYIHDKTNQQKPTQARQGGSSNTTPKTSGSSTSNGGSGLGVFAKVKDGMSNGSISKYDVALAIYIAAVKATWKVINKVENTVTPFIARETGDWRHSNQFENIRNGINLLTNPRESIMTIATNWQQTIIANKKQEQERLLLGDSILNGSSTSRKV